jgi:polyphosphate kinase 2 (PPK2 family)
MFPLRYAVPTMAITLSDYESGAPFDGDYEESLKALQYRLARVQSAWWQGERAALIVCEGWDGSGKSGAVKRMVAELDPRGLYVFPVGAPNAEERARHFLWRFWARLPRRGEIAIFDRSWYGRVLGERVEGHAPEAQWRRAFDEINEFEAQLTFDGALVVKLFFHVSQEVQAERLERRAANSWSRWKVTPEILAALDRRAGYREAVEDMLARTATRWAPWRVIDANDKRAARIAALAAVTEALDQAAPPPAGDFSRD